MYKALVVLLLILNAGLVIEGCAVKHGILFAPIEQREYAIELENGAAYSLSLKCSEAKCQYAVFDALAIPQASYEYNGSKIVQNKFLPPNRRFEGLFLHIIANYSFLPNSFSFEIDGKAASIERILE